MTVRCAGAARRAGAAAASVSRSRRASWRCRPMPTSRRGASGPRSARPWSPSGWAARRAARASASARARSQLRAAGRRRSGIGVGPPASAGVGRHRRRGPALLGRRFVLAVGGSASVAGLAAARAACRRRSISAARLLAGLGVEQAAHVDVAVGQDPQVEVVRVGVGRVGAVGLQRVEQQPQGAEPSCAGGEALGEQHERRLDPRRRCGGRGRRAHAASTAVSAARCASTAAAASSSSGVPPVCSSSSRPMPSCTTAVTSASSRSSGTCSRAVHSCGGGAQADPAVGQGGVDGGALREAPGEGDLAVLAAGLAAQPAAGAAGGVERVQLTAVEVAHAAQRRRP